MSKSKKKLYEKHLRIHKIKGNFERIKELDKLYPRNDENQPESVLIEVKGLYMDHGLEKEKMKKWMSTKMKHFSDKDYKSIPIDVYDYNNNSKIYHGHHRAAAQYLIKGSEALIHAVVYTIDDQLDVDGLKTIDDAVTDF